MPRALRGTSRLPIVLASTIVALVSAACGPSRRAPATPVPEPLDTTPSLIEPAPAHAIIPAPESFRVVPGAVFAIDSLTPVVVRIAGSAADADTAAASRIASGLSAMLAGEARAPARVLAPADTVPARAIVLLLDGASAQGLGGEGYDLRVTAEEVRITAPRPAGLYYGVQSFRQLLPPSVEHRAALRRRLVAPAVHVTDTPRYPWRGAMLDVSRHFLEVEDVKRYIDVMALYKLNRLHLHLSDDQGWRVEITSWPNLARHGGSSEVGGGPGGFYTQAELRDLVQYARERFIEIVPEIDVPGHTNAALASYPELNCDSIAPPRYTGIRVGFSALCVSREEPYRFLADVVREIGAITGPWFHIGGDEVERLTHAEYLQFIERAQSIVRGAGKTMIGWGEIAPAALDRETIVQHWRKDSSFVHAARGGRVIISAGPKMYLDMKYDSTTILGLQWAGRIEVRDSYDWDPATYLPGVSPEGVLGVEAPLWSETLEKREDFEFMAFPRLVAVAEVGWSRPQVRVWDDFRLRLAAHGPRLAALGVNYYRSPQVPWVR